MPSPKLHIEPLDRTCGTCNVCCTVMRVRALDKPEGQPCQYQTATGCGNYDNRPSSCREWFCMWIRDRSGLFSELQRPDVLGVLFTASEPDPLTHRQTIVAHETRLGGARLGEGRKAIELLRRFAQVRIVAYRPTRTTTITSLTIDGRQVA